MPPVEWFVGDAQVVHGTNFVVPPTKRAARVVTVHDLTVVRFPEMCDGPTLAFPDLIRRAVDTGAWVHTPSRFVADEVTELFGIPGERVRAVHHGVPPVPPPASGAPLPVRLPGGASSYVLAVGTVEPRKDYPSLVVAFGLVAAAHPDVALVIVGSDGWGSDAFHRAVSDSPFRSRIVHTGFLNDVELGTVLHGAAVLAYPSVYEGFGLPPLQAMAAGVPVVTTNAGAIPEVVGDGATVVPPRESEALAAALDRMLQGGSEMDAQVQRGRLRSEQFTWSACAAGLVDLYQAAAGA